MNKKVFVLGIDGAMPEKIFDEWLDELPNLKKLIIQGSKAKLNSPVPPISIVAWTSLTTGTCPADHGIFETMIKLKDRVGFKLASSKDVNAKRIWNIASAAGKKNISCFVPLTWPLDPLRGIILSGSMTPPTEQKNFVYPRDFGKKILDLIDHPIVIDLDRFGGLDKRTILQKIYSMTDDHFNIMQTFLANEEWDLFFGVIKGSDRMNHLFWKYCDEKHIKYEPNSEFKNTLKEYYIYLDKKVGELIEYLDPNTTIIILSDHGMNRINSRVNLSDWLIQEGYLVLKHSISGRVDLTPEMIDFSKTKAYAIGAYDGQIFINTKSSGGIIDKDEYFQLINELSSKLKKIKGQNGEELNTKIFTQSKDLVGKSSGIAPDIIVYFDDLYYGCNTSKIGNKEMFSLETSRGVDNDLAAHSQQGIFIMNNSSQKGDIGEVSYLDIAPTILHNLGVKIPEYMKGKVIE